jgi:hypothetical protein
MHAGHGAVEPSVRPLRRKTARTTLFYKSKAPIGTGNASTARPMPFPVNSRPTSTEHDVAHPAFGGPDPNASDGLGNKSKEDASKATSSTDGYQGGTGMASSAPRPNLNAAIQTASGASKHEAGSIRCDGVTHGSHAASDSVRINVTRVPAHVRRPWESSGGGGDPSEHGACSANRAQPRFLLLAWTARHCQQASHLQLELYPQPQYDNVKEASVLHLEAWVLQLTLCAGSYAQEHSHEDEAESTVYSYLLSRGLTELQESHSIFACTVTCSCVQPVEQSPIALFGRVSVSVSPYSASPCAG